MPSAVILGAGVSGLSTAIALQEAGFTVRIVAAAIGEDTTSGAAGAIWFPYRADPPGRVNGWAARTHAWLTELAKTTPEAGVDILERVELADTEARPWWADASPDIRLVREPEHGGGAAPYAWLCSAPRVEPALFLAWLQAKLKSPIDVRHVESWSQLNPAPGEVIVNCAGLGARRLTHDDDLQAVFGQTVITRPGSIDMNISLGDERDDREIFYAIPRRDEIVLGGCAIPVGDECPAAPDPAMRDAILTRAIRLRCNPGPIIRQAAGLRPCRTSVRLEKETLPADRFRDGTPRTVIHNYGHGGAGYTLCRGCAEEVVRLASPGT